MRVTTRTKIPDLGRRLAELKKRLAKRVPEANKKAGIVLLVKASDLVPLDTRALVESGRVSQTGDGFDTITIVGFGGKDLPVKKAFSLYEGKEVERVPSDYAIKQHQETWISHPNGGQAMFLSQPIGDYSVRQEMSKVIREEMSK